VILRAEEEKMRLGEVVVTAVVEARIEVVRYSQTLDEMCRCHLPQSVVKIVYAVLQGRLDPTAAVRVQSLLYVQDSTNSDLRQP